MADTAPTPAPRPEPSAPAAMCGNKSDAAAEVADKVTSSMWKPLLLCALYVGFLRQWYFTFKPVGVSVFSTVWVEAPIAASLIYFGLIYGIKQYMANRKPLALKDYMVTYNLYQTVLNLWCVLAFAREVYVQNMNIWGNPIDSSPNGFRLSFLIWVHYNNKYVELLDTIFMALRKKDKQISFLHVYHHVLLIWAWFLVCRYGCGGDAYFGALCNSFIHVAMYGYYLLALLKINTPWKKWLTKLQLGQFCICFAHAIYVFIQDQYPRWLSVVQLWVMINMLYLFGQFYSKTYSKKPAVEAKKEN